MLGQAKSYFSELKKIIAFAVLHARIGLRSVSLEMPKNSIGFSVVAAVYSWCNWSKVVVSMTLKIAFERLRNFFLAQLERLFEFSSHRNWLQIKQQEKKKKARQTKMNATPSHAISSHLISSHLILSYLILPYLILPYLILPYLISYHPISSNLVFFHLISFHPYQPAETGILWRHY